MFDLAVVSAVICDPSAAGLAHPCQMRFCRDQSSLGPTMLLQHSFHFTVSGGAPVHTSTHFLTSKPACQGSLTCLYLAQIPSFKES